MGTNLYMLAQLASQNCGIALLPDTAAEDFVNQGNSYKFCPSGKQIMVYSMLFIHLVEAYYRQYVYLLIIL